jgi:hypothetical protein
MNKKIFPALIFALMMLVSITVQAQQRFVVTAVTSGAEYIGKGHKSPLGKGATLTLETKVYIPYNGSLTVIDEATSKEYTVKSIGWAALEEKLADSNHTVLTRTKDYVKSVLAEVRKTPKVKARYVSDPATVTREKYVKKEKQRKWQNKLNAEKAPKSNKSMADKHADTERGKRIRKAAGRKAAEAAKQAASAAAGAANESRKTILRLTENDLHQIVKEATFRIINNMKKQKKS